MISLATKRAEVSGLEFCGISEGIIGRCVSKEHKVMNNTQSTLATILTIVLNAVLALES